jgi:hypothetical protein
MKARFASVTIRKAGEFKGFLKPKPRLFVDPLQFAPGELVFSPGPMRDALAAHETVRERFKYARPRVLESQCANLVGPAHSRFWHRAADR